MFSYVPPHPEQLGPSREQNMTLLRISHPSTMAMFSCKELCIIEWEAGDVAGLWLKEGVGRSPLKSPGISPTSTSVRSTTTILQEGRTQQIFFLLKNLQREQPSVLCMFSPCAAAFHRIMHNREWNFVSTISPPYLTLLLSSLQYYSRSQNAFISQTHSIGDGSEGLITCAAQSA